MRSDGVIEGASGLAFGRITVGALDDWDAVPADGVVCWLHGGNLVIWNKGELKNIKLSGGRSDEATPVRVVRRQFLRALPDCRPDLPAANLFECAAAPATQIRRGRLGRLVLVKWARY